MAAPAREEAVELHMARDGYHYLRPVARGFPGATRYVRGDVADALVNAARAILAAHPVFRAKPVGAPHSIAREQQDYAIAAEDALRAVIAKAEGQPQTEKAV